jgi:type IV secretory pathway VirB2 component (pilin)
MRIWKYCRQKIKVLRHAYMPPQQLALAVAALMLILLSSEAHAQGTAGLVQPILTWVMTNIVQGLMAAGVIVVGVLMIAARHTLAGVMTMAVGALVVANYQAIVALIPVGG